ncbi:helix-turn-helix transcriptional regulator [Halomonas sp. TD01]|uniref:helix-turn-helix transcriptional regulator n=1 Tax=Halomonas sp. TD01 TaxID=999141 RepID=UPI000214F146|nr:helix-turn-helix transcriptional regulator [Halomonas sp. TD01]EGP20967.1 DNA binding domain-containing protein [Halomonas sp. TD01]CAH1044081.1 Periplasmic molybdate-binding protein/domain [Halomonas sp. TD01]
MLKEFLTTAEVADYLRLKERKVYDLVRQGQIPCSRATGKLLFPRQHIDMWVLSHLEGDQAQRSPLPWIVAGSQDPLLEWAVRESGSDLASLCHGSGDGLRRLLEGKAMLAGIHLLNFESGRYNEPAALGLGGVRDLIVLHWAKRQQGLLVAPGNPRGIQSLNDISRQQVTLAHRQPDAGAAQLLRCLLQRSAIEPGTLNWATNVSLSEDDLALAIAQGEADVGLGVEAAAHRQHIEFIPLIEESFDLVMHRRSYFEPALQALIAFTRQERFTQRARALRGYNVSGLGEVLYNA